MKPYVVVSSFYVFFLQRKVAALIGEGYEPCGGLMRYWFRFYQAMRLK